MSIDRHKSRKVNIMDNQNNKNGSAPSSQKKARPHKHKSYFLEPATQQKPKDSAKVTIEKKDSEQNKNSAPNQQPHQNNAGSASKRNNNQRRNKNHRPQNNANTQKTDAVKKENTPVIQDKNIEAKDPQHSSNKSNPSNQRAHKKHHRRHGEKPVRVNDTSPKPEIKEELPRKSDKLDPTPTFISSNKSDRLERPAPQKLAKFKDSPEYEKYSDYEEYSFEELYGNKTAEVASASAKSNTDKTEQTTDEPMVEVVGIRFKASGKTYYFTPNGLTLKNGTHAIVETARGLEYGEVAMGNTRVPESETVPPLRPVVRQATEADIKHHKENKEKEENAFRVCNEKIITHELDMKLIDAQYTFDNSKLLFYFTSSGRVDFRDLVKDLASVFRTRIELRQIGIRDEAKMVGGLGLCGRPLCCSIFLTDFGQVSIKMAKEQNLSLNSAKISGACGRLMCCLRYEHETYEYEIKRTPPIDSLVRTVDGVGVVTEISPLAGTVKVRLTASPDIPPKSYKRDEVTILKKKQDSKE